MCFPRRTTPPSRLLLPLLALLAAACPRHGERPSEGTAPAAAISATPSEDALSALSSGVRLMEQFQHPQAEARFAEALRLHPGWLPAQADLAIAQMNQLDAESATRAEGSARAALLLAPADPRTEYVLAYVLAERLGRFPDALPHFRAATAGAPGDPSAWFQLGRTAEESARATDDAALRSEARRAYEKALELDPRSLEANYRLGRLLLESEDPADAKRGEELLGQHARLIAGRPAIQPNYLTRGALALAHPWERPRREPQAPRDMRLVPSQVLGAAFAPAEGRPARGLLVAALESEGTLSILEPASLAQRASGVSCAGAAAGDLDRNGELDAVVACEDGCVVRLRDAGAWRDATPRILADAKGASRVTLVDFDHDGDLDVHLLSARSGGGFDSQALRNDGMASFAVADVGIAGPLSSDAVLWTDFDLDNAVDLVAVTPAGLTLLHADRDGPHRAVPLPLPMPADGELFLETLDADGDDDPDLVAVAGSRVSLLVNESLPGAPSFRAQDMGALDGAAGACCAADMDLDGVRELVVLAPAAPLGGSRGILLSAGGLSLPVRLVGAEGLDARVLACADVDGDGAPDLAVRRASGEAQVLGGAVEPRATWARLSLQGREGRSNPQGFGAKLTMDAGSLHQRFERRSAQGACNVTAPEVVGLGGRARIDGVTTLWPSGIQQGEAELAAGAEHAIVEVDRQPSSCPMLYGWDGSSWSFLTDCFDTAPAGLWIGEGMHWAGDPDEVLRLRPGWVEPEDGVLNISIAEFLNETLLADHVAMVAVDHDAGRAVIVDEAVRLAAPPQPLVAWLVGTPRAVRASQDGRDVGAALAEQDDDVAGWKRPLAWIGLSEPHALQLELPGSRGVLVLNGSLNFSNSANLFGASQAGIEAMPARVELLEGGRWREIMKDCGVPAGFHKDVVIELAPLRLPEHPTIRITTNLQVSWDRASLFADAEPAPATDLRELPLLRAEKRWLGIPREVQGPQNRWRSFPRDGLAGSSPWLRQAGPATPDGDARAELAAADESIAFVRPGEELLVAFDDAALGDPAPGRARTHVLVTRGWVKDATPHTAAELSVLPLPRAGAELYP